jgi:hypothetical protein
MRPILLHHDGLPGVKAAGRAVEMERDAGTEATELETGPEVAD